MALREALFIVWRAPALLSAFLQVLRRPCFLPATGLGQARLASRSLSSLHHQHPALPWPFTLHLHPAAHLPGQFSPPLTRLPRRARRAPPCKRTGEESTGGRRRESRLPRERTEPPVPGWEPKGSHRLADPWREGPDCSVPLRGSAGSRSCGSLPAGLGFRGPALSARAGAAVPGARGQRAPPSPARRPQRVPSHPPSRSRGRRLRPRDRDPAAGAVPAQRRCRPAAELRPVPRPVPAREPPRRQPRRRCSVRRRQRPPVAAAERPSRRLWRAAGRVASAPAI